ncbi:MAG: hypothetical protein ACR2OZ_17305 [Verrucomicrobiales bacterium]
MAFPPEIALGYIEKAWREGRLSHAYLLTGLATPERRRFAEQMVRLVNRSTAASLEAMAGEGVCLIEPESKSRQITIAQIRALEQLLSLKGAIGKFKVGIVVDADRMNPQAANAFLKTLEEPPSSSLLLLLSGAPGRLLDTVLSRCTRVPLFQSSSAAKYHRSDAEKRLLEALAQHFSTELTPARSLALLGVYQSILSGLKDQIGDANEAERKREAAHYEKTTDCAKWLKDREDHHDALTSAQYLQARAGLLETVLLWFGDILRFQAGHTHLQFPEFSTSVALAARKLATQDLLQRLRCLEDLLRYYDTNVNEALATELAFLGAFG